MPTSAETVDAVVESVILVSGELYTSVVDEANDIGGSTWAVVEVLLDKHRLQLALLGSTPIAERITLSDLRARAQGPLHEVRHDGTRYWLHADHLRGVYELHRELDS